MTSAEVRNSHVESEREEGEIVDDIDELSDISSEEEFLLRQRLHVLESYNNVLERKKAKNSLSDTGNKTGLDLLSADLSEVSSEEDIVLDTNYTSKHVKETKQKHHKHKRRKQVFSTEIKSKSSKKKTCSKKKLQLKVISESSEESEDEYRNKRRKLENAVVVNTIKIDTSSLQDRIKKMLGVTQSLPKIIDTVSNFDEKIEKKAINDELSPKCNEISVTKNSPDCEKLNNSPDCQSEVVLELLDNRLPENLENKSLQIVTENKVKIDKTESDEDIELLRQHALNTKTTKSKDNLEQLPISKQVLATENDKSSDILSEDEDSDTAELRLICLKSALLKKAIEMKKKQKLQARLSQSSLSLHDENILENKTEHENNTDIESVDMEIGSDVEDKDFSKDSKTVNSENNKSEINNDNQPSTKKQDELEEDEDLLRAKLLTSLSKNLPSLVDTKILEGMKSPEKKPTKKVMQKKETATMKKVTEEKKFVINVCESDSEGEHEATKNLTKMHMKLSEQSDFQDKLDLFLKSTRMEVENEKIKDASNATPTPTKFVPKTVNHLPKSEQIEYQNLVKRMSELEKIKQARQSSLDKKEQGKEMLKPRNVSVDAAKLISLNNAEEQIAMSRKKIAEESSAILRLKEEETKLIQKQKIVATELRNINTAIHLNKKQLKSAQIRLAKIRAQHHRLINSSTFRHSNGRLPQTNRPGTKMIPNKTQKENTPNTEEYKNPNALKCVRVSVVNDLKEDKNETSNSKVSVQNEMPNSKLSVQIDVANNKKIVKMSDRSEPKKKSGSEVSQSVNNADEKFEKNESDESTRNVESVKRIEQVDDYKSPLQALSSATWEEDPNAVLCPYDIGGNCKDPDCKYLHPKPSHSIQ